MLLRGLGFTVASVVLATSVSAQTLTLPPRTTGLSPLKGQVTTVQAARVAW